MGKNSGGQKRRNNLWNLPLYFTLLLAAPLCVWGQFTDNFSDGNFTNNPLWTGNNNDWIVNAEGQLQSNNTTLNTSFSLSTANQKATAAQWDFYVRLAFNTSGANYVDVYLTASQSNITLTNTTGYFVRLGDTPDEVSLYRKDASGGSTKIIDGADGLLNSSNNVLRVRVVRTANNQWTLSRDLGSTGSYIPEGSVTDATYTTSTAFGIWVRQSTASFVQRHYFDDFEVKDYVPDITPPSIVSVSASNNRTVEVLFNESLTTNTAINAANYSVNNNVGNPLSAAVDAGNPLLIRLTFATDFPNGTNNTLTVNGVADLTGNVLNNGTASFAFYTPQRYDIVFNELMADPSPVVGLPEVEWIELKNTSRFPINLQGYRLARSSGLSGPLPPFVLRADSLVILAASSATSVLNPFGNTLPVSSFPTLPNDGDLIWLQDGSGRLMHAVSYSISWYQNVVKSAGGWTLEMIDSKNPCAGSPNWRASTNASGGTPGRANSVAATNTDQTAPRLFSAFAPNPNRVTLTFNEPLDSGFSAAATYSLSNGIGTATSASLLPPLFNQVVLNFATAMQQGTVYNITATNVRDCSGNLISINNTANVGLAVTPDSLDLIVNEILFQPPPLGVDYLEVYNRSNKILDAGTLFFANRSSTSGNLGTLYPLNPQNRLLFPGQFYAVTENPEIVAQQYNVKDPAAVVLAPNMPSFSNDKGTAVIISNTGNIIDELRYDTKWHFGLIDNEQGISLERIDYNRPTNFAENWTSAAASASFGTPGYENSQYRADVAPPSGDIRLNPRLFSPDNDGFEDFTLIEFEVSEPGYTANVTIFDAAGRPVKLLQRNTTIARRGSFRWDGLNDKQQRVAAGNYVVYFEIFNLRGQKQAFKKGVTVTRKF